MAENLVDRRCVPCEGGVEALSRADAEHMLALLHPGWSLRDDGLEIERIVEFPAYSRSLGFANAVAWVAIQEGHHPVLTVHYGRVEVRYSTHAIGGLSDNDFICAAKIDRLLDEPGD